MRSKGQDKSPIIESDKDTKRTNVSFAGETIECPHCGRKGSGMAIALHEPKCKKKRSRKL